MGVKCCAVMYRNWRTYDCGKAGKVEHAGKHYCGTHDPAKRAARSAAVDARIDRAIRMGAAQSKVAAARDALVRCVLDDVHDGGASIGDDTRAAVVAYDKAVAALEEVSS
jgi:hypothetical protein